MTSGSVKYTSEYLMMLSNLEQSAFEALIRVLVSGINLGEDLAKHFFEVTLELGKSFMFFFLEVWG